MSTKRWERYVDYLCWLNNTAQNRSDLLDDDLIPVMSKDDMKTGNISGAVYSKPEATEAQHAHRPGGYLDYRAGQRIIQQRRLNRGFEKEKTNREHQEYLEVVWRLEHEPLAPLERFWLSKKETECPA